MALDEVRKPKVEVKRMGSTRHRASIRGLLPSSSIDRKTGDAKKLAAS